MKAVVVFESMFGNTERLAREVAAGLSRAGAEVVLTDVRFSRLEDFRGAVLLVVGAPTHTFSLSRPGTRQDAVQRGAEQSRALLGVREWLTTMDAAFPSAAERPVVAVFDSRVERVRHWPGSAARKTVRVLRAEGFEVLDQPASFYVEEMTGPLLDGELARARDWAASLLEIVSSRTGGRVGP